MPNADAYHFTLRFRVPEHKPVSGAEARVPLPGVLGRDHLELCSEDGRKLSEARRLFVSGQGYDAEDQARAAAERARWALLLAAVESWVGVEWDDGPERGLSVWQGGPHLLGLARFGVSATATVGVNVDAFRERFARWIAKGPRLKPSQENAAALLAATHFDASDRSRFLIAYAVIEELGEALEELGFEPARRSDAFLAGLEKLVAYVEEIEVDQVTKKALKRRLHNLRDVGKTNKCRQLIEDVLDGEAAERFDHLVKRRGQIAHKGLSPPECGRLSLEACQLALELLLGTISRAS
jgi:hypothetical protein